MAELLAEPVSVDDGVPAEDEGVLPEGVAPDEGRPVEVPPALPVPGVEELEPRDGCAEDELGDDDGLAVADGPGC